MEVAAAALDPESAIFGESDIGVLSVPQSLLTFHQQGKYKFFVNFHFYFGAMEDDTPSNVCGLPNVKHMASYMGAKNCTALQSMIETYAQLAYDWARLYHRFYGMRSSYIKAKRADLSRRRRGMRGHAGMLFKLGLHAVSRDTKVAACSKLTWLLEEIMIIDKPEGVDENTAEWGALSLLLNGFSYTVLGDPPEPEFYPNSKEITTKDVNTVSAFLEDLRSLIVRAESALGQVVQTRFQGKNTKATNRLRNALLVERRNLDRGLKECHGRLMRFAQRYENTLTCTSNASLGCDDTIEQAIS